MLNYFHFFERNENGRHSLVLLDFTVKAKVKDPSFAQNMIYLKNSLKTTAFKVLKKRKTVPRQGHEVNVKQSKNVKFDVYCW